MFVIDKVDKNYLVFVMDRRFVLYFWVSQTYLVLVVHKFEKKWTCMFVSLFVQHDNGFVRDVAKLHFM